MSTVYYLYSAYLYEVLENVLLHTTLSTTMYHNHYSILNFVLRYSCFYVASHILSFESTLSKEVDFSSIGSNKMTSFVKVGFYWMFSFCSSKSLFLTAFAYVVCKWGIRDRRGYPRPSFIRE